MRAGNEILVRLVSELEVVPPPEIIRELVGDAMEDDSFLGAELIDNAIAASEGGIPADRFRDDFLPALEKDLKTLSELSTNLKSLESVPDPKLQALHAVLSSTTAQKVAVFTSFQDTALYLKERIENSPEILGGRSWTVVIGSETSADTRTRELERFCPESVTGDPHFAPA